jgi:hypothetical protein
LGDDGEGDDGPGDDGEGDDGPGDDGDDGDDGLGDDGEGDDDEGDDGLGDDGEGDDGPGDDGPGDDGEGDDGEDDGDGGDDGGDGRCNLVGGDGDSDGDGFLERPGSGDGCGEDGACDGVGHSAGGVVVVSAAGDEEETAVLDEGDGEDGRSEIRCAAAMEWAGVRVPGLPTARAVLAAATRATAPTATAARSPVIRRDRLICPVAVSRSAGGVLDGHRTASRSAVWPRWRRPCWSQWGPYVAEAMAVSSVRRVAASGRSAGFVARPTEISGRSGRGTGSSSTGSARCW